MELELPSRRPKRADAQRNFDALISAARQTFAEQGSQAALEDIARRAQVSIATLYRNFPNREDLVAEVNRDAVEALCRSAADLEHLEPWDALAKWLENFVAYIGTKLAFAEALNRTTEGYQACRQAMRVAGEPLLVRAQGAGDARPEAMIDDVLRMFSGVSAVEYVDDAQRRRVFGFALAGLRTCQSAGAGARSRTEPRGRVVGGR